MELLEKFIIYILLISSNIDYSILRPIYIDDNNEINEALFQHNQRSHEYFSSSNDEHVPRKQRQVVQPKWLTDIEKTNVFVDQKVHITDESLKEAAAIRKAIQAAVDEGTYAIDDTNSNNPKQPQAQPALPVKSALPVPAALPIPPASSSTPESHSFFMPPPAMQWQWNLHLPSNFPQFEPTFPAIMQQSDENAFAQEMRRIWEEFIENTRKMFSWN